MVGAVVDDLRAELLGRHVRDGADDERGFARHVQRLRPLEDTREAEVHDLHMVSHARLFDDEDVLGLEVPMHDARLVGGLEAREEAVGDAQRAVEGDAGRAMQGDVQRLAAQELHDQIGASVGQRREVRDRDEVWAREPAREQRLTPEPGHLVDAQAGPEHLDGDLAVLEAVVARPVHVADGAAADVTDDLVAVVELLTDEPRRVR